MIVSERQALFPLSVVVFIGQKREHKWGRGEEGMKGD